jgi:hypothetical protein
MAALGGRPDRDETVHAISEPADTAMGAAGDEVCLGSVDRVFAVAVREPNQSPRYVVAPVAIAVLGSSDRDQGLVPAMKRATVAAGHERRLGLACVEEPRGEPQQNVRCPFVGLDRVRVKMLVG